MLESIIEKALEEDKVNSKSIVRNVENVSFVIEKEFVRVESSKNWDIVLALVKWGENSSKYEIRRWKKEGTAGKGVTFTEGNFKRLVEEIRKIEI